jgi:hypothetical protein
MHVEIEHLQELVKKGFIFTKRTPGFFVKLTIHLTQDEFNVLNTRYLGDYILAEIPRFNYEETRVYWTNKGHPELAGDPTQKLKIREFCDPKGLVLQFKTPGEAKNWADEIRKHLESLKRVIDHNRDIGNKETFDL